MHARRTAAPLSLVQERVLDELFRHTLSSVDAAIVLVNPLGGGEPSSGNIVYVSSGWQQVTGFRADDVIGRDDCSLAAHGFAARGPGTEPSVLAAIAEAMGAGRACKALVQSYTADERPFWNMLSLSPVMILPFVGKLYSEKLTRAAILGAVIAVAGAGVISMSGRIEQLIGMHDELPDEETGDAAGHPAGERPAHHSPRPDPRKV